MKQETKKFIGDIFGKLSNLFFALACLLFLIVILLLGTGKGNIFEWF